MRPPQTPLPPQVDYFVGLDLAQAADFSAWAVVERTLAVGRDSAPVVTTYAVRDLRRWPLRTPYTTIVNDVTRLVGVDLPGAARRPDQAPLRRPALVVDATGVGAAVVDLFRAARNRGQLQANLLAVLITAGHSTTPGEYAMHVPKKALVSVLQVLLQARRLKVADLPERDMLVKELDNFQVKITAAGNETFESWREQDHDDLVLAVALACWQGERGPTWEAPPPPGPPNRRSHRPEERYARDGSPWARQLRRLGG